MKQRLPSIPVLVRGAAAALVAVVLPLAARAAHETLTFSRSAEASASTPRWVDGAHFPGETNWYLRTAQDTAWLRAATLRCSVLWPSNAPPDAQTLIFLVDREGRWYQSQQEHALVPGATNIIEVPFLGNAPGWQPVGHAAGWNHRVRIRPKAVGLRLFGNSPFIGSYTLLSASLHWDDSPPPPPTISRVRPSGAETPCCGLFEVAFDLPDRYTNPFDITQVDSYALFTAPDGKQIRVDAFYYQNYYRLHDELDDSPKPQGNPEWRVRFSPRQPGVYRYSLHVQDRYGKAEHAGGSLTATPAAGPRFVRVSTRDPRFFECDDGAPFLPIGHNIRSAYDTRMDDKFPWKLRHPEGPQQYRHFFQNMGKAGENLVEVWSCAWSLGLEWSGVIPGYHGAGDYHLGNAWELDRVMELARRNGLRVNLVLNNHGRVSLRVDPEWHHHPYNVTQGGWLVAPMNFFDDKTAIDFQKRLYRYYVARWGWDSSLFAWELFSEGNLVGDGEDRRAHYDPRYIDWHRQMATFLHERDPNRHLVTTHYSGDYRTQNPEICRMPEIDACAVDAYHGGPPHQIVTLIRETAANNNPFGKPVMITEFGGSAMAAGLEHLKRELHAALWTSVVTPIAGTPLFWWWQLLDEQQLYPEYTAIARFQQHADPRNPAMSSVKPELRFPLDPNSDGTAPLAVGMASPTNAVGWIYAPAPLLQTRSLRKNGERAPSMPMTQLVLDNLQDGVYQVDFVDTATGQPTRRIEARTANRQLLLAVPAFSNDIAYRATLQTPNPK